MSTAAPAQPEDEGANVAPAEPGSIESEPASAPTEPASAEPQPTAAPAAAPSDPVVPTPRARGWAIAGIVLSALVALAALLALILLPFRMDLRYDGPFDRFLVTVLWEFTASPAALVLPLLGAVAVVLCGRTTGRAQRGARLMVIAVAVAIPLELVISRGGQALALLGADPESDIGAAGATGPWMLAAGAVLVLALLALVGGVMALRGESSSPEIARPGRPARGAAIWILVLAVLLVLGALVEYVGNALGIFYFDPLPDSPSSTASQVTAFLASQLPRKLAEVGLYVALAALFARTAARSRARTGGRVALIALTAGVILGEIGYVLGDVLSVTVVTTSALGPVVAYWFSGFLTFAPLALAGLVVLVGGILALRRPTA